MTVIFASDHDFIFYKSGILSKKCPGNDYNHGVVIFGYGNEKGIPYFLVRNSWGSDWGEGGYIRVRDDGELGNSWYIGTVAIQAHVI